MDDRRALRHGFLDAQNGGKLLDLHADQLQGVEGGGFVHGGHRREVFPGETDLVRGKRALVFDDLPPQNVRQVLSGDDRLDTRQAEGLRDIDLDDPGVGNAASENLGVQHPGKTEVPHVGGGAAHLVRGARRGHGTADEAHPGRGLRLFGNGHGPRLLSVKPVFILKPA